MQSLQRYLTVSLTGLVIACSTPSSDPASDYYHPMRSGYIELQVDTGIYRVEVKSDRAYFGAQEAALNLWKSRARKVCSDGSYQEISVQDSAYEIQGPNIVVVNSPAIAAISQAAGSAIGNEKIGVRKGYVVCEQAGLSKEAAIGVIKNKGWPLE